MAMQRRSFLKNSLSGGVAIAGAGLLPRIVLADSHGEKPAEEAPAEAKSAYPENVAKAFKAKNKDEALKELLGESTSENSDKIKIKAPDIAENGSVVPIEVTTTLEGVETVALLVEKNPVPLIAAFDFPGQKSGGLITTRVKMGQTSNVIAVVKSGGKLYSQKQEVKVTIGGCGG